MLTSPQAEKIVRDCIRSASGFSGPIGVGKKLSEVGIKDVDSKRALNDEIVTNSEIGVQSKGYELGPQDLDFTTATKVFELRDQVSDKATPVEAPDVAFARAAAGRGAKGSQRRTSAGKQSARKGVRKSGKKGAKQGAKKVSKKTAQKGGKKR
jgi:hypothetical protein